jgi:hypothetical protein
MPGKGGNQKDFTRPKDKGDKWSGMHDNKKEGGSDDYRTWSGYVKPPMQAAGSRALNAGTTNKGEKRKAPKGPGPEHKPKGSKIVKRSK